MINLLDKLELDNKKIILIVIIAFVLFYFDFSFILGAQLRSLKSIDPKIKKVSLDLDNLTRDLARMQESKKKQKDAGTKHSARLKKFVSEQETTSLLKFISDVAIKNDVKIIQMKPSREQPVKADKSMLAEKFSALSISLDLLCDYHKFGQFMNDLENAQVFITAYDFKISSQQPDFMRQKVNLTLRTYVRK